MPSNAKIDQLYKDAAQNIEKAKTFLEKEGELSDTEKSELDRFLQQADEQKKRAIQLQQVLDAELAQAAREAQLKAEIEAAKHQEKSDNFVEPKFEHAGEFMVALYKHYNRTETDERLHLLRPANRKALAGEVGISGGFLLPTQQQNDILTVMGERSFVRQFATTVPMGARTVQWPSLDFSQGAAGVNAFTAGITVHWTEENTAPTASQPAFKAVELHARELKGLCYVPNGLLRDSPISLQAFFSGDQGFGGALAAELDYKAINGAGAGSPMGILNAPAKVTVSRNASTTFKWVDAVTMLSKMLMTGNPRWIINQSVMPQLLQFVDAGNNSLFVANAAIAPQGTLLGLPVEWTGKNPALGTAGDVILADWSYYLLGDRQTILMEVDMSYKFAESQTVYKATLAVDGQPWLNSSIKLMDGATIVSPYVVLS